MLFMEEKKMQVGTVQKLISIFNQAFQELGVTVSLEKLEDLAVTIHRGMTVQARHFHTLEHVFNFVDSADPIRTIAALYHDIVYYQVDMGFSPQIWEIIAPYIRIQNGDFYVVENLSDDDHMIVLTLGLFDLQLGQKLSSVDAMNEFLSAVVMIKQLDGLVSERDLLRMTVCIEATIPFRGHTPEGKNHFEMMEQRLLEISTLHELGLSLAEVVETIKTAVIFTNKDIENFGDPDPGRFLDNTWKLLPETNAAMRLPDVYSIATYRQALQKVAVFFAKLDPTSIFGQYRGVPADEDLHEMSRHARNNITISIEYLRLKILTITILEALAKATGGDAPTSLFMGDIPREGVSIKRIEYFLPEIDDSPWAEADSVVYRLLESGRATDTSFDMKNSPLTLFVYKSMSPEKISASLLRAEEFYTGQLSAHDFLRELDPAVIRPIARASAVMVFTRRQQLLKFAEEPQG
jgi:hypothetical protein